MTVVEQKGLAGKLRDLRQRAGLTQAQLSDAARVSRRSIIRWESGAVAPWIPELRAVLTVLEATPSEEESLVSLAKGQRLPRIENFSCPQTLGAVLRTARIRGGLTVRDISDRLSCSPSTVSRWECAKLCPSADDLTRLWSALRVGSTEVEALRNWLSYQQGVEPSELDKVLEKIRWPWDEHCYLLFDVRLVSLISKLKALDSSDRHTESLLARAHCAYARFLCDCHRFEEAIEQAQCVWAPQATTHGTKLGLEHEAAFLLARSFIGVGGRSGYRHAKQILDSLERRPLDLDGYSERLCCYAELLSKAQSHERAVETGRRAVDTVRDKRPRAFRDASVVLAQVLLRAGDPHAALDVLPPICEEAPRSIAVESLLWADVLLAVGRPDDAAHWRRMALDTVGRYNLQSAIST